MASSAALHPNALYLAKSVTQIGKDALVQNLFSVKGWVCVVTGGGTGLGLLKAVTLAQNGAKVYITGRRKEILESSAASFAPKEGGGSLVPVQSDLSTKQGIMDFVKEIESREVLINLLINNHGFLPPGMDFDTTDGSPEALRKRVFEEDTMENWEASITVNTASYYFLSFGFLPLLAAAKTRGNFDPGNIINVVTHSTLFKRSPASIFTFTSTKAALDKLGTLLASEFAVRGLGIRVNALLPGEFPSALNSEVAPEPVEVDKEVKSGGEIKGGFYRIPWGRAGTATEYAAAMMCLATNSYMTGAKLVVDGAVHLTT